MMSVWKYALQPIDHQTIEMPLGARILSVGVQRGEICLWALVGTEGTPEKRRFRIAGTGHPIGNDRTDLFLGTVQLSGGSLVFHVFEVNR